MELSEAGLVLVPVVAVGGMGAGTGIGRGEVAVEGEGDCLELEVGGGAEEEGRGSLMIAEDWVREDKNEAEEEASWSIEKEEEWGGGGVKGDGLIRPMLPFEPDLAPLAGELVAEEALSVKFSSAISSRQ